MGLLGILGIEVTGKDKKEEVVASAPPATNNYQPQPSYTSAQPTASTSVNTDKFREYFDNLFASANLPGPDYYEFKKGLKLLGNNMSEQQAYSTAFQMQTINGLKYDVLLNSIDQYLGMLKNDDATFKGTLQKATQEKVTNKQLEIQAAEQKIQEAKNKIEELHKFVSDTETSIGTIRSEIYTNEQKIKDSEIAYGFQKQALELELTKDKANIISYCKA